MDWIKDWGAHIISLLGIMGGLWAYLRHDKKLKSQEEIINNMQIRQLQKSEAKELQADIKANLIPRSKNYRIRFVNAGQSDALNVRIKILTPEEELTSVLRVEHWGPYDLINPQSYREEIIALCEGHPDTISIKATWDDSSQKNRTVILSVPL